MNDSLLRRALLALLALSLLLSVSFALRVPVGDNPDETAHRDYIRLIVEERGFVKFIERNKLPEGAPSRDEAHQPPLYYLLCAPVYAASGGNPVPVRLVSTVLQLATVALAFFACRDLFPKRGEIAVGAAAFVACLPIQAQLGGAINNDSLSTLLCAAIFWRLGAVILRAQTVHEAAWLGILFGLGLWTKLSVVQLVPAFAVAYFLAVRGDKMTLAKAAGHCAGALILGTVLASPWLIRNTLLYGDPLTLAIYRLTGPNYSPADIQTGADWTATDYLRNVGIRSFATFFYFLHPNLPIVPLSRFVGPPVPLLTVCALMLASLVALYRRGKVGDFKDDAARLVLFFGLAVPLLLPFYLRFVLTVFQAQGRYFLPALLPVAIMTAVAWMSRPLGTDGDKIPPRWLAVLGVPILLLLLAVYQLIGGGFLARP
ncbi:MAG: glycosyltransferase family 39 protein [Akkermansiaceae bacterium]|nr:glycosyltransferase family 39 protein [Armatimonadota bacterium]